LFHVLHKVRQKISVSYWVGAEYGLDTILRLFYI